MNNSVAAAHVGEQGVQGQRSSLPVTSMIGMGNSETTVSLALVQPQPTSAIKPAQDWAAVAASTPYASANRFEVLGTSTDDDQFIVMRSRRNKRSRQRSDRHAHGTTTDDERQPERQPEPAQRRRRAAVVYGKSFADSAVSAARQIRKKAVFCVDNVKSTCTIDQMKSFISLNMRVEVVSCFQVHPRRRRNEDEDRVVRKAFFVCIYHDDRHRFLDAAAWSKSIIVSVWYFKQQADRTNKPGYKRRRVGNSGNEQMDVQTHVDPSASCITPSAEGINLLNAPAQSSSSSSVVAEVHVDREDTILVMNSTLLTDNNDGNDE